MPRKWLIAAVVLPLVIIALGIVKAERHLSRSTRWVFDVTGYDPRDLLRGQYLQYRLDLHERAPRQACEGDGERCCYCLTAQGAGQPPKVERATCELARSECDGALQTRYAEPQRYYISEARAEELTRILQDASAKQQARLALAVDSRGAAQIEALLINGEPIEQVQP